MVWEEDGKYPDLIIKLLSDLTAQTDRNLKKELYQNRFRTPEYFWFSPETLEFAGYRLMNQQYEPIPANEAGWLWSEFLGLYLGVQAEMLGYFTEAGDLVLSPAEQAEFSEQQAQQAKARAALLTEQLRGLGIEPEG